VEARTVFHEILADRFRDPFNAYLASLPQGSLAEKQALAQLANGQMRQLGLIARCPKTGTSVFLRGDSGHSPEQSRFQLCRVGGSGLGRTCTAPTLFQLDLMPDQFSREPPYHQRGPRFRSGRTP